MVSAMYLWLKFFHIALMFAWLIGLFSLPRLMAHLAATSPGSVEYQRLLFMVERQCKPLLYLGVPALLVGLAIPFVNHWWGQGWVHTEITLGVILLGYNGFCWKLLQDFQDGRNRYSLTWYRGLSTVPVVVMLLALYLAIFQPF